MNAVTLVIAGCILTAWAVTALSNLLDARHLSPTPPSGLADIHEPEEYARSQRYARARLRLATLSETWTTLLTLGFLFCGGFHMVDEIAHGLALELGFGEIGTGLLFFLGLGLLAELAGLPFHIYHTFVLENRYGFNRTSTRTFLLDKLKSYVLAALIGGILLAGIFWLLRAAGPLAWIWCWGFVGLLSLALTYVAPTWILPLFNAFTPLEQGPLRTDIEALAEREGFALSDVYVMDGSRRSAKANAFFTGLGRKKRIALFDTLLDKMDRTEITAVLAHEVGHWKLGHIRKSLLLGLLKMGALFFLLSLLLGHAEMIQGLGVREPSVHAGLTLFALLFPPVSLILSAMTNALSRRHEFQADAFAAKATGAPQALAGALRKLARQNLANLTPHPLSVALFHSHPPLGSRLTALENAVSRKG